MGCGDIVGGLCDMIVAFHGEGAFDDFLDEWTWDEREFVLKVFLGYDFSLG